jgi:hypothetical protein
MKQGLFSVEEVTAMINNGDVLLLAGSDKLLSALPTGKWIGGVSCRFVENGVGFVSSRQKIFVHNISHIVEHVDFKTYDTSTISNVFDDAHENGFSVIIMPFASDTLNEYAQNCMEFPNFANRAVCGWVSSAPMYSDFEKDDVSLAFCGHTGVAHNKKGVAMHIRLHNHRYTELHTFSPMVPGKGDVITFGETKSQVEYVLVNGIKQNFRQYLINKGITRSVLKDTVLVGDYAGIVLNLTLMEETENDLGKYVSLAATPHTNVPYRFGTVNTKQSYDNRIDTNTEVVFSLSCVKNFGNNDLFKKHLVHTNGPLVYGEIAYFHLNFTTIYVTIGTS